MGDQEVFAGARATDIEEMALPFLDESVCVISIGAGERVAPPREKAQGAS